MKNRFLKYIFLACILTGAVASGVHAQRRGKDKDSLRTSGQPADKGGQLALESLAAEGMKFMMKEETERALPVFDQLIQQDPKDAAGHYLRATALIKLDRLDEALESAKKAYDIDKENQYYAQQLAELYAKKRKFQESSQIYETLLSKNPENIQYGIELASVYVFSEQFDKAIEAYNVLERSLGVTEEITHQKEQLYLRQNKLENALTEAKKLIAAEPGEVSYRVELAEMLIANDRIVEAVVPLEEALKINPDEAQAHVLLADIYRRNGDIEKCNQELKQVFANPNLDADPKIRVLSGYLSMLKTPEDMNEAVKLARQLAETHPGEAKAVVMYADMLNRQGKKTESRDAYVRATKLDGAVFQVWQAILQLDGELNQIDSVLVHSEQALELFPNQGTFWYSNGIARIVKKQYKEAVSSLEEALKLTGEMPELVPFIHAQLGDAYNGLGDHIKSDASYDLALQGNPNNDHVLNNYSYFLSLRKEKLDLALRMSEKLVRHHQDNATYLDTYAWVLYIRKDYKKAKELLEKAIQDSTGVSGTIVEHYGDVLFKLGERDGAVAQWKKAKTMGETTDLLDKKIATGALHEQ